MILAMPEVLTSEHHIDPLNKRRSADVFGEQMEHLWTTYDVCGGNGGNWVYQSDDCSGMTWDAHPQCLHSDPAEWGLVCFGGKCELLVQSTL